MRTGGGALSLGDPLCRESFGLHRVQDVGTLLLRPAFGRSRGRSLESLKLLQGVRLQGGGGAVVGFVSQVVFDAVEADAAGRAFVVVAERQRRKKAAAAAAAAVARRLPQAGPLAQVDRAVAFRAGASCPAGRDFLLHCQAQNGGRRGGGGSRGSSSGGGGSSSVG